MSRDNNTFTPFLLKKVGDPPEESFQRRGSGYPPLPPIDTSCIVNPFLPFQPMQTIVPRPFPPPSLAGVPMEYIIEQLRDLAALYWDKPETADCTLVVPIPQHQRRPLHPSTSPLAPSVAMLSTPSGPGRRATEPSLYLVPEMTLKLNIDYLSAHSSFLRGLFGGASPLDLLNGNNAPSVPMHTPSSSPPTQPLQKRRSRLSIPPDRFPRLLPSSPNHPVVFLPVPDPSSFQLLVHWMYFGDTKYINDSLKQGLIEWEGIARNVEYLGLSNEIKLYLGDYFRRWMQTTECSDDETMYSDSSNEGEDDRTTLASPVSDKDLEDVKEPSRGRTRTARPLSMNRLVAESP